MQKEQPLIIALAADLQYETQVMTLIKSLCYHHKKIKIYLLHKTYANEWFELLNKNLKQLDLNNEVVSITVGLDLTQYKTLSHITESTFYRLFASYIPENRVIYLDSDIVVDKPLTKLMEIDFKDLPLLAIEDAYLNKTNHKYPKYPDLKPYFNAGVLVLNIPLWQKENLSNILLKKLKTESNNMIYADQDLLNSLLCKRWKKLNNNYNFQTGIINDLKDKNIKPNIIHYTGENKPWKRNSDVIFKNKYWFYYQLSWQEIFDKWKVK